MNHLENVDVAVIELAVVEKPDYKIYTERMISVCTFFFGPLVGGYMLAENFKAFNEPKAVERVWITTIVTTFILILVIMFVPEDSKIPNSLFPLIYSLITYYCVHRFQKKKIDAHVHANGEFFSWGRAFLIGIIGFVTILAIVFFIIIY